MTGFKLIALGLLTLAVAMPAQGEDMERKDAKTLSAFLNPAGAGHPGTCAAEGTGGGCTNFEQPGWCCAELGGKSCCGRCRNSAIDIGPISGQVKINQPIEVNFRPRDIGGGDAVIYTFGRVDWGDGAVQSLPVTNGTNIKLTHTYTSAKTFIIRADAGAQFKYHGDGSCSYECCVNGQIPVDVKL